MDLNGIQSLHYDLFSCGVGRGVGGWLVPGVAASLVVETDPVLLIFPTWCRCVDAGLLS